MTADVIQFDAKIDADWKISIPAEHREHLPSRARVILSRKNPSDTDDLVKTSEGGLDFWDNEDDQVWDNV